MNSFFALLKKDIKVAARNYYFAISILIALLFTIAVLFIIPKQGSLEPTLYFYSKVEAPSIDTNEANIVVVDSKDMVLSLMKKNYNSLGLIYYADTNTPSFEIIKQGYENEKLINALILALKEESIDSDSIEEVKTVVLRENLNISKIPLNKSVVPLFLTIESVFMGFILIAALIFIEKEEDTIRAYAISPGSLYKYFFSKIAVMIILGLISSLTVTVFTIGLEVNYIYLLLLVIFGSIFATSLGLFIASFFNTISQSLLWLIVISMVLSVPFASYFVPSFAPFYIRIMPTYPLMTAIKEAVFPTGAISSILSAIAYFILLSIPIFIASVILYRKDLQS